MSVDELDSELDAFTIPDAGELTCKGELSAGDNGEVLAAAEAAEAGDEQDTFVADGSVAVDVPRSGCESDGAAETQPETAPSAVADDSPDHIDLARKQLADCTLARMALERQLKFAKKREKEAAEELRDLVGRQQELPLSDPPGSERQKELIGDDGEVGDEAAQVSGPADASPDAWRSVLITELHLKPATETKLTENDVTTIGQLEDLRGGAGLRSLRGIGQAKADAIEEAVLAWLTENRDKHVFDQPSTADTTAE